jgi:RHS repeat-associated protein
MRTIKQYVFLAVLLPILLLSVASAEAQGLPSGWSDQDIGNVGVAGSASYSNGVFTVTGAGSPLLYGSTDGFHFAYQEISGDATIVARVTSVSYSTAEAAVMIRETLNSGATEMSAVEFESDVEGAYRTTTGGSISTTGSISGTLPYWVKVVRSGNTFTAYTAADGVNWFQVGSSETINMAETAYIGLAVTSQSLYSSYTATFDNLSVSTAANPAPAITGVSATTGSVGEQVTISGSGFGATQGSSEVLLNGSPVTIDSWSGSSITITIPSGATSGYLAVSVAPSMDDSNPVVFTVEANPLPTGWLDQDIGVVGKTGTASYSSGVFTVAGAGSTLFNGTSDGFHFAYLQISGDATIVARVVSVSYSTAQAAVMIRETLNSGATEMSAVEFENDVEGAYRTTTGGNISTTGSSSGTLPYWIKLVRSGNTFTAYTAADGINWVQVGSSETINMAETSYIGLGVTSQTGSSSYTATFDNASVSTAANPAPSITGVSATTASVGQQVVLSGSGFGATQGNSEVLLNDVPVTISSWSNTAIAVTIPAGASSGSLAVSVAPSMNASNPVDFIVETNPLPSGWLDNDIGVVGQDGSAGFTSGAFTITGAGNGFVSTASDGFHFAYQQISGDVTVVARVVSVSNGSAIAGVMIRETLDSGSRSIIMADTNAVPLEYYRLTPGSTDAASNYGSGGSLPYWLKLVRSGNMFTGYASFDGKSWAIIGVPMPIDMAQNVYVGLAESSRTTTSTYTASFDNVSITTTANPAPQITSLSATTGPAGTQTVISGSGFGASQGTSTAFLNDGPLTITLWSDTAITATIPSGATSGYIVVALGPNMISSNAVYFTVTAQPLPSSWLDQDIGVVGKTGSATYANGVFTVQAGGTGVSGQADSFHFVYQPLATDGAIEARVDSQTSYSQAGVMIRAGLDAFAAEAFSYFVGEGGQNMYEYMNSRPFENSYVTQTSLHSGSLPYWVRVVRNANQLSAYVSSDGSSWYQVGATQTLTTEQTVYVGLGVANDSTSSLATATFDSVSVGPGDSLPNPVITGISPTSGAPGQSVTINGSGFGATQGSSNVQFDGAAATISSWSDSQIIAVAPDEVSTGPVSATVSGITAPGPTFTVGLTVQVTDSLGNQTSYTSGIAGGAWMITNAQGSGCSTCTIRGNIQNQYDGNGNPAWTIDALGNTTGYAYDSNSNMTTLFQPLSYTAGAKTTYAYNSLGEVTSMTDALGNVTSNTYDSHGNLLTVTTPPPKGGVNGSKTQFAYNSLGELTQITDPLNNVTKITYTSAGYIATITDPKNNVTTYGYDSRGNRTSVTDAMNNTTTFSYDAGNRLTQITYPDSSTMSFGYDYRGRRTSVTDQNGKTTTYVYDNADRLTSVTDAAGNMTQYSYDTEGNLLSITDANNNTTSFTYDAYGRVTQTTFPSSLYEKYQYDADNNLTSKTDRKDQTIQYVYDALNRLIQKTYPDSTTAEYTYDLVGKILSVNDPTGNYGFSYDNMGRLIGTTTTYSFLPNTTFSNSYSYDANSNRTGYTTPDNSTNTYTYDTLNRLTALANSWAGTFNFSYDTLSRRTQMTRPNGVATNYTYDNLSHLLSVLHQLSGSTMDGAVYTLDAAGNRSSKTDDLAGVTSNYTYDKIYELAQVMQGANTTESYSYDLVGNRLSSLSLSPYNYNTLNELTSTPSGSYTYDSNGNVTGETNSSGTTTYAWDFENRLTSVTLPGQGGTVTFKYDPFGRRIEKISPTTTSIFAYDGDNLVETVNATGGVIARYTQTDNVDEPLAMQRGTTTSYYEADGLGSITSLSNSSGALAQTYTYDSFGNTTNSSGSLTNFFRYTGREFDTETNLYYYRNRYYDPSTGRFLSEDPVHFRGGIDFYDYVYNNPLTMVDPLGLAPKVPWNRIRTRDCNALELAQCAETCGAKGVQSCKVVQQFRITRVKDGRALWKWADGPMSCSCNDPEECPQGKPQGQPAPAPNAQPQGAPLLPVIIDIIEDILEGAAAAAAAG